MVRQDETWGNMIWYDSPPFDQDSIYCQDSILHVVSKGLLAGPDNEPCHNAETSRPREHGSFSHGYFEATSALAIEKSERGRRFGMIPAHDWAQLPTTPARATGLPRST